MKKNITIIALQKYPGHELLDQSGIPITLIPEPGNQKDPDAIQVFAGEKLAGYVGNAPITMLDGTVDASWLNRAMHNGVRPVVTGISFVENPEVRWMSYIAEVDLQVLDSSGEEEGKDYVYPLIGSNSLFPARIDALKELQEGSQVPVTFKETDRGIEVETVRGSLGVVKEGSDHYEKLVKTLRQKVVQGQLSDQSSVRSLKVSTALTQATRIFDAEIERIVLEGILSLEEIEERLSYLQADIGLPDSYILEVLSGIQKVSPLDQGRLLKRPGTKFVDYGGYMYESIIYKLRGKFLRYVGGKATGKNTCAETLAWIFNRPIGEVAVNEGLDKIDLTGSRVIDSDEDGNLKMPFDLSTFAQGLKKGWFLIVDEVNTANASLLTLFHGLDTRRRLDIPGYGTIQVHPQAAVILTMNEEYVGTMPLNEATADRFTPIVFDDAQDIRMMLKEAVPSANSASLDVCQNLYEILRTLHEDGSITSYPISIRGFVDALEVEKDLGLKRGLARNVIDKGVDKQERMVLHQQLDLLFA